MYFRKNPKDVHISVSVKLCHALSFCQFIHIEIIDSVAPKFVVFLDNATGSKI